MSLEKSKPPPGCRSTFVRCPHCSQPARIRTSRSITPLVRQFNLACLNVECGHTFGAQVEITHTISPSACPNPAVELRMSAPRRKPVNDNPFPAGPEVPAPAVNDETPPAASAVGT